MSAVSLLKSKEDYIKGNNTNQRKTKMIFFVLIKLKDISLTEILSNTARKWSKEYFKIRKRI